MNKKLTFLLSLTFHLLNRRGTMRTIIFVFLFSLTTITPVHANSGNDFMKMCSLSDQTRCLSYLNGVTDMIDYYSVLHEQGTYKTLIYDEGKKYFYKGICFPEKIRLDQLSKIMKKYFNDNPKYLKGPFVALFELRMGQLFPCKKKNN